MTEIQSVPAMSGEAVPAKELKVEIEEKEKKKRKKLVLIFLFTLTSFIVVMGLIFVFRLKKEKEPSFPVTETPEATTAPESVPTPSPLPEGLEGKIIQFEKKLEEVDLEEQRLEPPDLDFELRFEEKE